MILGVPLVLPGWRAPAFPAETAKAASGQDRVCPDAPKAALRRELILGGARPCGVCGWLCDLFPGGCPGPSGSYVDTTCGKAAP